MYLYVALKIITGVSLKFTFKGVKSSFHYNVISHSDAMLLSLTKKGTKWEEEERKEFIHFSLSAAGKKLENCHPS